MMDFIHWLFMLVVVTRLPVVNSQQLRPQLPGAVSAETSKIIRFFGDSFIRYDFSVLTAEMLSPSNKESLSMQFITQDDEGLIWMFKGQRNEKLHLSIKDGKLLFVIDDGSRLPQQVLLTPPNSRVVNDFQWHPVKIEKEGRLLKFYIDDQYVTQITARSDIQFVARGHVFLGGVRSVPTETGGLASSSFDGAITNVTTGKFTRPARELILSFLQFKPAGRQGKFEIIDPGVGFWTTRPTPVQRPTPVTFRTGSSSFVLSDPLDLRRGGGFSFRFRTLEPRGILAFARGSAQSKNFLAVEIFDGILYFVYDFGTYSSRKMFSDQRVDDGEWHEVAVQVDGSQLLLTLDGRSFPTTFPASEILKLFFNRLYFGGYDDMPNAPWPLYNREGYRGCFESLKINGIGVDLHSRFRDSNILNVEIGCRSSPRLCQTQPCVSGYCRDTMDGYVCECANTPFTGQNCGREAVIGSWDGTRATNYEFINRQVTHTNDISFRFLTPLRNTLLFKTEVGKNMGDDYIQAELVDGVAQVTVNVGGQRKVMSTGSNLNDYFWHTLYIRRRADDIEISVDDEPKVMSVIGGENYNLKIDRIIFGSLGDSSKTNNYIGYLQNFIYDDRELLGELRRRTTNIIWIENKPYDNLPLLTYKPVTVTSSNTYFRLPSMRIGRTMKILFKFKTRESNGVILYNAGTGSDVIAIELSNGLLRLAYNLGGRNMYTVVDTPYKLNDNEWHTAQVSLNERGQFTVKVDATSKDVTTSDGNGRLDIQSGVLYIGGLPEDIFKRSAVTNLVESRKGFRGCLASMDINGAVPELIDYATDKQYILKGCTDLDIACNKPGICGTGICMPGVDSHWCDCNMTGYVGVNACDELPIGYYFGNDSGKGILLYEFPLRHQVDSMEDSIAFGFKTYEKNGVLYRLENSLGDEYIEIRLENGHIVAISKMSGDDTVELSERSRFFNDGQYHVVRFIRTGEKVTLRVDNLQPRPATVTSGKSLLFNKVYRVILGGRLDAKGAMSQNFYGIIGGANWNGYRWLDMYNQKIVLHGKTVQRIGSVDLANPFILFKGGAPTTAAPRELFFPPIDNIPPAVGGGGVVEGIGGAGPPNVPPLIGGPGGELTGGPGIYVPGEPVPLAAALVGPPIPLATGARAGAVVGTVIGTLAFLSSLVWALYKMKPGVPAFLSPGAASAAGGPVSISAPRAASNLAAVQAAGGAGGAGAGGAGATKLTVVNGSAAGTGAGGGGSTTYTSYYSSTSTAVTGGGAGAGGADAIDSSTLRATGTFSNKGTALGTPKAGRAAVGSSSSAYYQASYGGGENVELLTGGGGMGGSSYDRQYMTSTSSSHGLPDYDLPVGSGTLQSGYSTSTLNTHYNYQVQNLKTVTMNKQGQYVLTGGTLGAVTPGAAADEVRVDCCLMTNDGRNVVTGSSLGPPQVWNMANGELLRIMKGDTIGSTDLHLVCGDRLLVGAVHADMEINEYSGRKGVYNHTLQIWDFETGKPLSMAEGEYCSALCPMSDSDKVLFGRTDKFGDATSIIAWDLMGNQMIKSMRYDAPVGNNDYINFLALSKNDRYVVAGFTNSFDNFAEFMVFDMTLTSYEITEPAMLKLDANPDCTAILPKDEAVTGLRNGDLVIWSIRTGQPSRQLLGSGGAHAHSREVKSVTLSEDGKYLVSASADGTLKVWDMHTERPIHTLTGHSDEVWCSSISPDNEIVVSGSSDGTIRLWRMKNGTEMCVFNCGVDIFFVTMSHDKGTIVALGDKFGARKLIMLQVVRTKIKKIVSS